MPRLRQGELRVGIIPAQSRPIARGAQRAHREDHSKSGGVPVVIIGIASPYSPRIMIRGSSNRRQRAVGLTML